MRFRKYILDSDNPLRGLVSDASLAEDQWKVFGVELSLFFPTNQVVDGNKTHSVADLYVLTAEQVKEVIDRLAGCGTTAEDIDRLFYRIPKQK